jgi:hypothetical protein
MVTGIAILRNDMRPAAQRYPADFYTVTKSNAAVIGIAADTLQRLYKTDPSLGFMIQEGTQLISHPSSMEAWGLAYEAKKAKTRNEKVANSSRGEYVIVWMK